jgi:hypothetical protein
MGELGGIFVARGEFLATDGARMNADKRYICAAVVMDIGVLIFTGVLRGRG